MDKYKNLVSTS